MNEKVIAVVGATASGKTSLGVELALRYGGEVISADSMQIYEGMDIATAKPTETEMRGVKHRLIGFKKPTEVYSVSAFCDDAEAAVTDILNNGRLPIIVGGTGLYIDSFLTNTRFSEVAVSDDIRNKLKTDLREKGIDALYDELLKIDSKAAESIHKNNTVRVLRALEIYRSTGKTITEQNALSHCEPPKYDVLYLGLGFKNREVIYERINRRVDEMLANGLLDEAREFYSHDYSQTAVNAIGYKELKPFIDGKAELCDCVEKLKCETRKYAKRQITWFKRNSSINWLYVDDYESADSLYSAAFALCDKFIGG